MTFIDFRHIQYPFHLRFAMVKRTMQHRSFFTRWEYPLLYYNEKSLKKTMQTLLKIWFQTNVTHGSVKPASPQTDDTLDSAESAEMARSKFVKSLFTQVDPDDPHKKLFLRPPKRNCLRKTVIEITLAPIFFSQVNALNRS